MTEYEAGELLRVLKPYINSCIDERINNVPHYLQANVIDVNNDLHYATVLLAGAPNRVDQAMYIKNCSGKELKVGDKVWVKYIYNLDNAYIDIKNDGQPWGW